MELILQTFEENITSISNQKRQKLDYISEKVFNNYSNIFSEIINLIYKKIIIINNEINV